MKLTSDYRFEVTAMVGVAGPLYLVEREWHQRPLWDPVVASGTYEAMQAASRLLRQKEPDGG